MNDHSNGLKRYFNPSMRRTELENVTNRCLTVSKFKTLLSNRLQRFHAPPVKVTVTGRKYLKKNLFQRYVL